MKCGYSEELLALYVEGDLVQNETARVEGHLLECADCCEFTSELRHSQSIFKSLRQETISGTALASVRQRVFAKMETSSGWVLKLERHLLGFRRKYALAGLAIVAVASVAVWQIARVQQHANAPVRFAATPPEKATLIPGPAPEVERVRAPAKPVKLQSKPKPAPMTPAVEEHREFVVKMLTDDPNVIIYWLVDLKGGSE